MHAYLFVGSSQQARQDSIQKMVSDRQIDPVDIVNAAPEGERLTIADIRAFQKRLLLAPIRSSHTIGVILNADIMTTEAQNALLKLLEEPPPRVTILLESDSDYTLLATIISRCTIIRIASDTSTITRDQQTISAKDLFVLSEGKMLAALEPYTADREHAKDFVFQIQCNTRQALLAYYSGISRENNPKRLLRLLRNLETAQSQLAVNCNPRLVLDRVFLQ